MGAFEVGGGDGLRSGGAIAGRGCSAEPHTGQSSPSTSVLAKRGAASAVKAPMRSE
ncbi:MAG: hypothetical protein IPI82_08295 [Candidatus Microthrix sp.]|nr:hypothetical protein [Candidatus Microthrix sp.]MBK7322441.1 hypothetical protein [Candidatus Microthrix sp.]